MPVSCVHFLHGYIISRLHQHRAAEEDPRRAAKRERLGIKETEQPASQVGNRRYARGRAYAPDRFGEAFEASVDAAPEGAEESAE